MTPSRTQIRLRFLETAGVSNACLTALPNDASFRRYYRIRQSNRPDIMLMDAPPTKEDVRPYVRVAKHLVSLGLSAPQILYTDEKNGFLLIEDFGDDTFSRLLADSAADRMLYEKAVDVLVALHLHPRGASVDVPPYDLDRLLAEVVLLPDWFWPEKNGQPCPPAARSQYLQVWRSVFGKLPTVPQGLVLRDYHVDNLMWLPDRGGAAVCGLLDFQDALIGPWAYDLVSLLEDARRDISPALAAAMQKRYFNAVGPIARDAFDLWYAALGAQRHAKVIGIFIRLFRRDGKPQYLKHIPRVIHMFARHLDNPVLSPVREWMDDYFPDYLDPLPGPGTQPGR